MRRRNQLLAGDVVLMVNAKAVTGLASLNNLLKQSPLASFCKCLNMPRPLNNTREYWRLNVGENMRERGREGGDESEKEHNVCGRSVWGSKQGPRGQNRCLLVFVERQKREGHQTTAPWLTGMICTRPPGDQARVTLRRGATTRIKIELADTDTFGTGTAANPALPFGGLARDSLLPFHCAMWG